jgi:hypothetical protein
MKTLSNILKTVCVIGFLCVAHPILWVLDVYDSVAHPDDNDINPESITYGDIPSGSITSEGKGNTYYTKKGGIKH